MSSVMPTKFSPKWMGDRSRSVPGALGPVMEIDGTTHGRLSAADTTDVLQKYE